MKNHSHKFLLVGATVVALTATACSGGTPAAQKPDKPSKFQPGSDISYTKYGKAHPTTTVKDCPGPCT